MEPFNPIRFGFVLLRDFEFPGGAGMQVYEFVNHPAVDGRPDFLRLNLYLTRDGNYVTIWFGLLEPIFTEAKLRDDLKSNSLWISIFTAPTTRHCSAATSTPPRPRRISSRRCGSNLRGDAMQNHKSSVGATTTNCAAM